METTREEWAPLGSWLSVMGAVSARLESEPGEQLGGRRQVGLPQGRVSLQTHLRQSPLSRPPQLPLLGSDFPIGGPWGGEGEGWGRVGRCPRALRGQQRRESWWDRCAPTAAAGHTWRARPPSGTRPCPGVAGFSPRESSLPAARAPLRRGPGEVDPARSGTPPLLVTGEPRPARRRRAPPPPRPPRPRLGAQSAGPMLLSGAPPAGSGPGPRAQGGAGGGPGGSRRGAGGPGAGPGGGGSGGVAKWLREHLGFRGGSGGGGGGKPAPPEPDYRPPVPAPAAPPAPPPDILAAYRLQRERDFEDPYSGGPSGSAALAAPVVPGPTPPPRHGSPPHRLIRVETPGPPAPPPEERTSGPPAGGDRVSAGRAGGPGAEAAVDSGFGEGQRWPGGRPLGVTAPDGPRGPGAFTHLCSSSRPTPLGAGPKLCLCPLLSPRTR